MRWQNSSDFLSYCLSCVDSDGGFDCTCDAGYEVTGAYSVIICVDINECDGFINPCTSNGVCTNTDGVYTCDWIAGYEFDGINIDECDSAASVVAECGEVTCVDSTGGFSYTCNEAYVESGT